MSGRSGLRWAGARLSRLHGYRRYLCSRRRWGTLTLQTRYPCPNRVGIHREIRQLAALPVATALPRVGQRVLTLSYPIGVLPVTATEGMVMGIRPYGRLTLLQINAATSVGSQGAPVLDERGAVVGVVAVKNPTLFQLVGSLSGAENIGFAVPIGTVLQRLNLTTRGGR